MHVTALELFLVVIAAFVIFGPKKLPKRQPKQPAIKPIKAPRERAMVRPMQPLAVEQMRRNNAAAMAPSPLKLRAAQQPLTLADEQPRFVTGKAEASLLPHEMPH